MERRWKDVLWRRGRSGIVKHRPKPLVEKRLVKRDGRRTKV